MQPVTYRISGSNRLLDVLSLLSFALFLLPFLITVGLGLRWLEVPGTEWIESHGALHTGLFWQYFALTVFVGLFFAFLLRWKSPERSFLALDDAGLTYSFLGMRRTWLWRDLESAEVINRMFGMKAGRLIISGTFGWKARLGILFLNGLASPHRLALVLPDLYGTRIAEIVAKLTEYREKALGTTRRDKTAVATPPQTMAAPGQPVTYAKSASQYGFERVMFYVALGIVGLVIVPMGALVYLMLGELPELRPIDEHLVLLLVLMLGHLFVGVPASLLVEFRRSKPKHNRLALDGDGLTYVRRGKRYAWPWQALSAFEYQIPPTIIGRPVITFAAPGRRWTWWWLRLTHGLLRKPPSVVIEDIYDTPLDEIAATLNAYRERALDGAPQAPDRG